MLICEYCLKEIETSNRDKRRRPESTTGFSVSSVCTVGRDPDRRQCQVSQSLHDIDRESIREVSSGLWMESQIAKVLLEEEEKYESYIIMTKLNY